MAKQIYQESLKNAYDINDVVQNKAALQDGRRFPQSLKLADNRTTQRTQKTNKTGLPNNLKQGVESLSGMSMDNVKVHYNSSKPAQLNAHAYAQGTDIHLAPGQEKHLPHEAWHVVQQAQGRVQPTMQMKDGVLVNDNVGLESEADVMGKKANQSGLSVRSELPMLNRPKYRVSPLQRLANVHGMTPFQYQRTTGWTVLGWGRLTGPGIITGLAPVRAGLPGHAEDQLMAQANLILGGVAPGVYTSLEIWTSSSPCSTAFGTQAVLPTGCLEDLQAFAVINGMVVHVHAQKPYQPRGFGPGMKQNSVNAANFANGPGNIPHDFDTRTGVATALPAYVPPAGLPVAGGTVAQLLRKEPLQLIDEAGAESEKKKKSKGKLIVTYE